MRIDETSYKFGLSHGDDDHKEMIEIMNSNMFLIRSYRLETHLSLDEDVNKKGITNHRGQWDCRQQETRVNVMSVNLGVAMLVEEI